MSWLNVTDRQTQVIIGAVYVGVPLPNVPFYAILIYVMLTDKELRSNPQYKVLKIITLLNFGQLLLHTLTGFFILFPEVQSRAQVIVRICGCTLNSLWLALFPPTCVLSVVRILIVYGSVSAKKMPTISKVLLAVGWLYATVSWLWGCITQNIFLDYVVWSYDLDKPGAAVLSSAEWLLCIASLGISYVSYLMIVILLHVQKSEMHNKSRGGQIRVFMQSTFAGLYMMSIVLARHHFGSWYQKSYETTFVVQCAWILFSYLNSVLLISLNKTVQTKILRVLRRKKKSAQCAALFIREIPTRKSGMK